MGVRRLHEAMDCDHGSTDWTHIGTRILQAAELATAVHLVENAGQVRERQEDASEPIVLRFRGLG